jgi:hypothetical protein
MANSSPREEAKERTGGRSRREKIPIAGYSKEAKSDMHV